MRIARVNIGTSTNKVVAEATINGGMVTSIDPRDIKDNAQQLLKNFRVRYDKTITRPGYKLFTDAPNPSNLPVMLIASVKDDFGVVTTLRFSNQLPYLLSGGTWVQITGPGPLGILNGSHKDRITLVFIDGQFVFSNNGIDPIQKINFSNNTFAQLGNAPNYKYITGFYERVVGANLPTNAVQIGWSGQKNIAEWDNANDLSANAEELVESPSDRGDHITGIFGISNLLVIARERSIWIANKRPSPSSPFEFRNAVPGVGSDIPYSIKQTEYGIIFADSFTGTIWSYVAGGELERIGAPIENEFRRLLKLSDKELITASYNPTEGEYTIIIPSFGNVYTAWTWNRNTNAWTQDEYPADTWTIHDVTYGKGINSINDLVGTIDGLAGVTIDELSNTGNIGTSFVRMIGMFTGDILVEAKDDPSINDDAGTVVNREFISKTFYFSEIDTTITKVRVDYEAEYAGSIDLYISADDEPFTLFATETITEVNKIQTFMVLMNVRCSRFKFMLKSTTGRFKLLSYEVHQQVAGETKDE